MSKSMKRDATEAFGGSEAVTAAPKKRTRRKDKRKEFKAPASNPKSGAQDAISPPETSEAGRQTKIERPAAGPQQKVDQAPHAGAGSSRDSRPQGKWRQDERHPEKSLSAERLLPVTKDAKPGQKHGKTRNEDGQKHVNGSKGDRRKARSRPPVKSGWEVSIQGGYFLDQDPLLSEDEQYLILPTKSHLHIYSAATSLLVQSIFMGLVDSVTSCILCPSDPEQILVSTYGGTISKHSWTTGRKLQQWKTRSGLLRIYGLPGSKSSDNGYRILAINQRPEGERDLSHLTLHQSPDVPLKEVVLHSKPRLTPTLVTADSGRFLVCSAVDRLIIGSAQDPMSAEYTWREFTVPGKIVSFDARIRQAPNKTAKSRPAVELALGLQDGVILILDDILNRLMGKEKGGKGVDMVSRRLHWHRDLVSSVKWSRDGNYLISGGSETVLVLWQLDTHQQQYLPHLSAPICNIVVSKTGSSYAMRMADNTVMVLSTSDLIPSTNICGPSVARASHKRLRATLNPNEPDQLLLATPSDLSPSSQPSFHPSATMLQTFDLKTNHQISRQALARNVTTVVNVDPKGQRIVDPDVVQVKVSHNGLWLATVDEWTPPANDREPLDHHADDSSSQCRTETRLRFWSWEEDSKAWQMITRVDEPHSTANHSVLGLAANPARAEFVSAGRDGYIRIWAPMIRLRNGLPIKNFAGESLHTWTCIYERRPDPLSSWKLMSQVDSVALAYSEDGSTIAVSFSCAGRPRVLHFVDSRSGSVRECQAGLCLPGDVEMVFSGTRLLLLSDTFLVWDVVNNTLVSKPIILKKPFVQNNGRFLVANAFDRTFALALNPEDVHMPAAVAIFNADKAGKVLHQGKIHGHVKALMPAIKGPGYVVVDGEARVLQLRPGDAARKTVKMAPGPQFEVMKGLNDIFGSTTTHIEIASLVEDARPSIADGQGPSGVSDGRPRSLQDILEQQAFSAPLSVAELFEKVAGLFRKAR